LTSAKFAWPSLSPETKAYVAPGNPPVLLSDSATPILNTCEISCSKNDVPGVIGEGSLFDYPGERALRVKDDHGEVVVEIWPPSVEDVSLVGAGTRKFGRGVEETFRVSGLTRDGDSYTVYFQCREPEAFERTKEAIDRHRSEIGEGRKPDEYLDAVIRLLKSRPRVNLSEVGSVLTTFEMPGGIEDARHEVETLVEGGKVEGMVDGNTFVNSYSISTGKASYAVAISFDFKDESLQIRCPKCAAAIPKKDKDSIGTCQYCGTLYFVPSRVFKLL